MKRVLFIVAALVALLVPATSCKDVEIVVTATVQVYCFDGSVVSCPATNFGPYRYYSLSDRELRSIFLTCVPPNLNGNFQTALMHLERYNRIEDRFLVPEDYSVIWDEYYRDYVIDEVYL